MSFENDVLLTNRYVYHVGSLVRAGPTTASQLKMRIL